jgi:hypothetical protein
MNGPNWNFIGGKYINHLMIPIIEGFTSLDDFYNYLNNQNYSYIKFILKKNNDFVCFKKNNKNGSFYSDYYNTFDFNTLCDNFIFTIKKFSGETTPNFYLNKNNEEDVDIINRISNEQTQNFYDNEGFLLEEEGGRKQLIRLTLTNNNYYENFHFPKFEEGKLRLMIHNDNISNFKDEYESGKKYWVEIYKLVDENEKMKRINALASILHEEWREGFDPSPEKKKERIKKNSDGTEGNINVPFDQLHADWKKENLAAATACLEAASKFQNNNDQAANYVHVEWMKRNPKESWNASQHVPYAELSQEEKDKDILHVIEARKILGLPDKVDFGLTVVEEEPEPHHSNLKTYNDYNSSGNFTNQGDDENRYLKPVKPVKKSWYEYLRGNTNNKEMYDVYENKDSINTINPLNTTSKNVSDVKSDSFTGDNPYIKAGSRLKRSTWKRSTRKRIARRSRKPRKRSTRARRSRKPLL